MNDTVLQAAALIIPLVVAIVFHEVAHGWTARALGDPTAAESKRLTLNPLRHVDPIGTIVVPGLLALIHAPIFGWAKPVPVNKWRLRNPRSGMMLVAAAGPASNLVLAAVGAVLLGLLYRLYGGVQQPTGLVEFVAANLGNFLAINVFLALFNLLPIPPFDGSHIVEGLLPRAMARGYGGLQRYGFVLILVLLFVLPRIVPGFDLIGRVVMPPFEWLFGQYAALVTAVAGAGTQEPVFLS